MAVVLIDAVASRDGLGGSGHDPAMKCIWVWNLMAVCGHILRMLVRAATSVLCS